MLSNFVITILMLIIFLIIFVIFAKCDHHIAIYCNDSSGKVVITVQGVPF